MRPRQAEMTHLCEAKARRRNQTELSLLGARRVRHPGGQESATLGARSQPP